MNKWSNEKPTKDGYYWHVRRIIDKDGNVTETSEPLIVYIDVNDEYSPTGMSIQYLGSDDDDSLPEDMVFEFEFESINLKTGESQGMVYQKIEHWLMYIEDVKWQQ